MKVLPFKISKPNDDALIYQEDRGPIFYNKLHQHEELQISWIVEGSGTLVVGDTVNHYHKNDVIVIGSRLPHVFKSELQEDKDSIMFSLFFSKNSFGAHFFELDELQSVAQFFKRATVGYKALSHFNTTKAYFLKLFEASNFDRFIILMQLLAILSKCKFKNLSSFVYQKQYSDREGKRMAKVMEYTMEHFQDQISLTEIAKIATMTKNAFCTYFKKRTNKTYTQFLNELRVEHTCKLLLSKGEAPIVEIAEQAGFNNLSNFNRRFKDLKKMSPNSYRKSNKI